jgi:hypothetical protein
MSFTLDIGDQLEADSELIDLLKKKNYRFLIKFLDTNYRFIFCTQQSGAAFDSCIDWCAQNAGNLEDAKQVLVRLFDTFYPCLPPSVKDDLAYLAEEIGYDPSKPPFSRPKRLHRELVTAGTTGLAAIKSQGRKYLAFLRVRLSFFRERWAYFRQSLEKRVSFIHAPSHHTSLPSYLTRPPGSTMSHALRLHPQSFRGTEGDARPEPWAQAVGH